MFFKITKTKRTSPSPNFELKIIERTSTTLKIEAKRNINFFNVLIIGMGGIGLIIFVLANLIYSTTLITLKCERLNKTQVDCKLSSSSLIEERITPIPVKEFQGAELAAKKKNGRYSINLLTSEGNIPLYDVSDSSKEVGHKAVKKINNFISDSEQVSLKVQHDKRWSIYAYGGVFGLIGISLFFRNLVSKLDLTCILDADTDRMYLKRQNLFKNTETREEILYEIRQAQIVEKTNKEGKKTYNIKLLLRSDNEITLLPSDVLYNPYKITQSINHFLDYQSRKKS